MKKQSRSEARRAAFTQIFQMNMHRDDMSVILEQLLAEIPECEDNLGYIKSTVDGVIAREAELEEIISANLRSGWTISRISKASLAILKLAVYEMKYADDVPPRVAINEAVELAKQYGADGDAKFVNGLLGSVYKTLEK